MAGNLKMKTCRNCDTVIAAKAKKCSACGARQKAPLYRRGWFIFLIIMVFLGTVGSIVNKNAQKNAEKAEMAIEYGGPDSELADMPETKETDDDGLPEEEEGVQGADSQAQEPSIGEEDSEPDGTGQAAAGTDASEQAEAGNGDGLVDGMRPEFKEAMDSYETFYDEYCEFMQQYADNSSDLSLLTKYTELISKAAKMDEKFSAWEGDMNDAEQKYYLEVNLRILQKLAETGTAQ